MDSREMASTRTNGPPTANISGSHVRQSSNLSSNLNTATSDITNFHLKSPRSSTSPTRTVSSAGLSRNPSSTRPSFPVVSLSGSSLEGKRNSLPNEEDDDDEDVEIKISPTGSVLAPSPNPYDKTQKLRQANAQLMASRLPPKPPGKVRFNDSVIATEESGGDHAVRSKKPKTNVTLPPTLKKN